MSVRALVVGGTNGIGYAMACCLAKEISPSKVVISGRTKPASIPHTNIEFRPIEATSMRQIKQFTDAFKTDVAASNNSKLDYLIMSQGIMTISGRTETSEGIDRKMALHYYGKQLLIRELLPALADDAKVITVYDGWSGNPAKLNWDDLDLKTHYGMESAAQHAIVMTDIMVQMWAAQQQRESKSGSTGKRHFIHAYPGGVRTGLHRELPWYLGAPMRMLGVIPGITVSAETCAKYLLDGSAARAKAGQVESRYWSNIDNKGRLLTKKAIFTEDEMKRVADHTWALIDRARGTA